MRSLWLLLVLFSAACSQRTIQVEGQDLACDDGSCLPCEEDSSCPLGTVCCDNACAESCDCAFGTVCGHDRICHDLDIDFFNCGACERSCEDAGGARVDACQGGECLCQAVGSRCLPDTICCTEGCVYADWSHAYCGGCQTACTSTQVCVEGVCLPDAPGICGALEVCSSGGVLECTDLDTHVSHCGGCDVDCTVLFGARVDACVGGQCLCSATGGTCGLWEWCEADGCHDICEGELDGAPCAQDDWVGDDYCANGDVVQAFATHDCGAGVCEQTIIPRVQVECPEDALVGSNYCANGDVVRNFATHDCVVDACEQTITPQVQVECPEDAWVESNYCDDNGDVVRNQSTHACNANNGTCDETIAPVDIETCAADELGDAYCFGGHVVRDQATYDCVAGTCEQTVTPIQESCDCGCSGGSCTTPCTSTCSYSGSFIHDRRCDSTEGAQTITATRTACFTWCQSGAQTNGWTGDVCCHYEFGADLGDWCKTGRGDSVTPQAGVDAQMFNCTL